MKKRNPTNGIRPEMRLYKHQSSNTGQFLTPTVNSYKLQLAAINSVMAERLVQRPLDIRLSKDVSQEVPVETLKMNMPRQVAESRLTRHNSSRPVHTPVLAFVTEFMGPDRSLFPPPAASPCGLSGEQGSQAHRVGSYRTSHSAGATFTQRDPLSIQPAGDITALRETSIPGFPVAMRSRDDGASSSERLDMDSRGLEQCPLVEREESLRLLNLQHNLISRIQNLSQLRRLVFLDMYDNCITELSGLSSLTCLRVLMLGKNRIKKICNLDNLTKLDVLDLHSNQIGQIENLSHLAELRVLNLAGNCISRVDGLLGLDSLTELNLRRNLILAVTEVDRLPCLQRLFLSHNSITSFHDLACLGESCSLSELTLDGNPIAQETWYKQAALRCVLQLRQLDMKRITEEERRQACALAKKDDERKREGHKLAIQKTLVQSQHYCPSRGPRAQESSGTSKEKRRLAVRNAAQQWEDLKACLERPAQGGLEEGSPEHSSAQQTADLPQQLSPDQLRRASPGSAVERPPGGSENKIRLSSRPSSPKDTRFLETGGTSVQSLSLSESHLAELDGENLRLFGPGALEVLERGWSAQTAGSVAVITFYYMHFDAIVPTLPRIRVKFPNLSHLVFVETNISRLLQLAALAQLRRLDQLTVHPEGNSVVTMALWRPFVIYRLHHFNLQKINDLKVTVADMITAERLFGTLGHIAATETPHSRLLLLLEESRKHQLQFLLEAHGQRAGRTTEELRENSRLQGEGLGRALLNYPGRDVGTEGAEDCTVQAPERVAVTRQYLRRLVRRASDTNLKGESLHKLWPSMFVEMVRDCVLGMRDRPAYRQACLRRLSLSK